MIALDTNVLIYACDKVDPNKQNRAIELISTEVDAVLLWQVACEFVAASRKLSTQGFTSDHAWARLSLFPLILPTDAVLERAKSLHMRNHCSFWDAMIVAACLDCGVTRLFSEDLPGRVSFEGLAIVNPFV